MKICSLEERIRVTLRRIVQIQFFISLEKAAEDLPKVDRLKSGATVLTAEELLGAPVLVEPVHRTAMSAFVWDNETTGLQLPEQLVRVKVMILDRPPPALVSHTTRLLVHLKVIEQSRGLLESAGFFRILCLVEVL
jgi:hypothetical protein